MTQRAKQTHGKIKSKKKFLLILNFVHIIFPSVHKNEFLYETGIEIFSDLSTVQYFYQLK